MKNTTKDCIDRLIKNIEDINVLDAIQENIEKRMSEISSEQKLKLKLSDKYTIVAENYDKEFGFNSLNIYLADKKGDYIQTIACIRHPFKTEYNNYYDLNLDTNKIEVCVWEDENLDDCTATHKINIYKEKDPA